MPPASPQPRIRPSDETLGRASIGTRPAAHARRIERRRRELHLRRLRRDLLEDVALAILLMIVTLLMTAGLGVIALLEIPTGAVVLGSFMLERRYRSRDRDRSRSGDRRPAARRRRS